MAVGPNEERLGGKEGKTLAASSKSNIQVDAKAFGDLKRNLADVTKIAKELRESLEGAAEASSKINVAGGVPGSTSGKSFFTGALAMAGQGTNINSSVTGGGAGGGGGGGGPSTSAGGSGGYGGGIPGIMGTFTDAFEPFAGIPGKNVAGGARLGQQISDQIAKSIGAVIKSVDQRIERGTAYATTADRYNVQLQQLTGQSQMQVMQNMRQPLTQYRLGAGGVNAFMQFQAQTGQFNLPENYAASVAGIRALSGYSKSTADVLTEQQQLMDPEVANRMFFMGGVNAFTAGGGMRDPMEMRQQIAQRMGLSNPNIARSALMPGSVTRARLADMGIGEEMQTEIIQYGLAQNSFRERGGTGQYDPSNPYHRKVAGIEDNLATSQEETSRVQTQREEQFMERQIDNMKTAEDINRALISALAAVEDKLSGLIGVLTTTKPIRGPVSGALGSAGKFFTGVGAGLIASGVGAPLGGPIAVAGGILSILGGMGDGDAEGDGSAPPPNTPNHNAVANDGSRDSQIMVPSGARGSRKIPLSELKASPRMANLQPSLRERLVRMMRERPSIGITSGYRDEAHQERLFYEQMEETSPDQSQIEWQGKYWKSKPGYAFTAPPGSSMHGVGLAADIFDEDDPSYSWIVSNSARFGLNNWRARGWRDDEPWHVQPDDVPRFRSQYEGGEWNPAEGASKRGNSNASQFGRSTSEGIFLDGDMGQGAGGRGPMKGGSIVQLLLEHQARGFQKFLSGGRARGLRGKGSGTAAAYPKGGNLSALQIAQLASDAGFTGDEIQKVVAIAGAESGFQSNAFNGEGEDLSYGLMQINMYGGMGPERREQFGLSNNEELYDPATNMKAAFEIYKAQGWKAWTTYEGSRYNSYLPAAGAAQFSVESKSEAGDPMPDRAPTRSGSVLTASGSTTNNFTSSPTVNVSPVINFNGAPGTPDLRRIAQDVTRMIKEEVEMLDLRNA